MQTTWTISQNWSQQEANIQNHTEKTHQNISRALFSQNDLVGVAVSTRMPKNPYKLRSFSSSYLRKYTNRRVLYLCDMGTTRRHMRTRLGLLGLGADRRRHAAWHSYPVYLLARPFENHFGKCRLEFCAWRSFGWSCLILADFLSEPCLSEKENTKQSSCKNLFKNGAQNNNQSINQLDKIAKSPPQIDHTFIKDNQNSNPNRFGKKVEPQIF